MGCTATDDHDNASSDSFTVTVEDTTAPVLTVPADIIVEATGPAGATVRWSVSATDVVDGSVNPTCTPASGSTFALGTTTVTCSATDAAGNVRRSRSGSRSATRPHPRSTYRTRSPRRPPARTARGWSTS